MIPAHTRKERQAYNKLRRFDNARDDCTFCIMTTDNPQFVREGEHFRVIRNRTPYSFWDGQGVVDHLMIVPKQHTDRLGKLSPEAAVEYMSIIEEHESKGYNVYARAPGSSAKSVVHQHTHLIKTDGKGHRLLVHVRWPLYARIRL